MNEIKSKAGRKPVSDKKKRIVLFVEQSIIDLNGGEDNCKLIIYQHLKTNHKK